MTLNDVTEANRKPSKRRYNPSYRSKSSCDVICAVESRASCTQRRDRGRINCKSAIKVFLFHSKKSSRLNRRDTIVVNFFRSRVPFFKFLRSLTYNTTYNEIIARRRLTRRRFPWFPLDLSPSCLICIIRLFSTFDQRHSRLPREKRQRDGFWKRPRKNLLRASPWCEMERGEIYTF